ncbi:MAG: exodeoxyribonuclease III [Cyanobacteriota bacterium]|nr:exodeoxyribonuclease III [Cyanobacteriota bacterium]
MEIATWNVNSIRSRQEQVIAWLQTNPVDVLCLQETKVIDGAFPAAPFQELGYHCQFFGQKAYNGVAILSRKPLEKPMRGFAPLLGAEAEDWDQQKRVITGIYQGVRVINLYVPNGAAVGDEKYAYKLNWLTQLKQYLQELLTARTEPSCLCGDFNIALEDRDIYSAEGKEGHIMASPPERAALAEILSLGWQDGFRKFTPESGHFSWWDYRSGGFARNRGWRIDHIYLDSALYDQAVACRIDREPRGWEKPSDHAPVVVAL